MLLFIPTAQRNSHSVSHSGQMAKTRQKLHSKNSWNWVVILLVSITIWQVLNVKFINTWNGNDVSQLKIALKNSWNHIMWTYFWFVLPIWNHSVSVCILCVTQIRNGQIFNFLSKYYFGAILPSESLNLNVPKLVLISVIPKRMNDFFWQIGPYIFTLFWMKKRSYNCGQNLKISAILSMYTMHTNAA